MKIGLEELRKMVGEAISEAKKKKKEKIEELDVRTDGHVIDKRHDFSQPLGGLNAYRQQGQTNFGPYTGDISSVAAAANGVKLESARETRMRQVVKSLIAEKLRPPASSAWSAFVSPVQKAPNGIWESAMHWYDFQQRGLGQVKEGASPDKDKEEKKPQSKGKKKPSGKK
jgi:hypothetical protein